MGVLQWHAFFFYIKDEGFEESLKKLRPNDISLSVGGRDTVWMYSRFDFNSVRNVLFNEMDWTWMLFPFPFGI